MRRRGGREMRGREMDRCGDWVVRVLRLRVGCWRSGGGADGVARWGERVEEAVSGG
jgi:hypothetical protein